jgi:uncharacterized protein
MGKIIRITSDDIEFLVEFNESKTAQKIQKSLPITSRVNLWDNEIYFQIPVQAELENGVEILDAGSVAYWPPGSALCIFFGKTPASTDDRPRAASPVTVVGTVIDNKDISKLKEISDGDVIELCFIK